MEIGDQMQNAALRNVIHVEINIGRKSWFLIGGAIGLQMNSNL